ncbi:MAG: hypothetical protein ACYSU0_12010 [Planctomycetota bacterium]|jgi:hypothetical protein
MKKVLENVPTFRPQNDCGWMRYPWAVTCTMSYLGDDVDYAYLMGISGAAFRLHVEPTEWGLGAQDPHIVDAYPRQLMRATGYTAKYLHGREQHDDALAAIRAHIDKGIPAMVGGDIKGHHAPDFWSVITGYDGDRFLRIDYLGKGDVQETEGADLVGPVLLIEKTGEPLAAMEALRESFRIALEYADVPERHGGAHGLAAYKAWIDRLGREEEFAGLPQEEAKGQWFANAMNYEGLCDARGSARRYLGRMAGALPAEDAAKLEPVADKYDEIQKLVFDNWKWFPFPQWVREKEGKIWTPVGSIEGTTWSRELRRKQVEALRAIEEEERQAYALIKTFIAETE